MSQVLSYERPLYTEQRQLPRFYKKFCIIFTIGLACVPLVVLAICLHAHRSAFAAQMSMIGPGISAIVLACTCTIGAVLQVYPDRLQIDFVMLGKRFKSYRGFWSQITDVRVVDQKTGTPFRALQLGAGEISLMFAGVGVQITFDDRRKWLVGTDQPQQLFDLFTQLRPAPSAG